MKLTFRTWGNSLAVRIPAQVTRDMGIVDGSKAEIREEEGRLVLTIVKEKPSYTLAELLEGITPENKHAEVDTGPGVGKEEW